MIVILMGATGSGKTTVGTALAAALGWPFHDADDLHPAANVEKMRRGTPLTDEDRAPWLARIRTLVEDTSRRDGRAILACSALRERYRETIAGGLPDVRWVWLAADAGLLDARVRTRTDHFAGPALIPSQLSELEPPAGALALPADRPVDDLVRDIVASLMPGRERAP